MKMIMRMKVLSFVTTLPIRLWQIKSFVGIFLGAPNCEKAIFRRLPFLLLSYIFTS